jgi:uncharacterized protein
MHTSSLFSLPLFPRNQAYVWFSLLLLPFFLNDFSNIFVRHFETWLVIDYVSVKLIPMLLLGYVLYQKKMSLYILGIRKISFSEFLYWTTFVTICVLAVDQVLRQVLVWFVPPICNFGTIPWDASSKWARFDEWVGLGFVGILEEVIFRGVVFALFAPEWLKNRFFMEHNGNVKHADVFKKPKYWKRELFFFLALGTLLFSGIHWSLGAVNWIITGLAHLVFMLTYLKSKSLWPGIFGHFFVNYVWFSGMWQ